MSKHHNIVVTSSEKDIILMTSIFSSSHNVFKAFRVVEFLVCFAKDKKCLKPAVTNESYCAYVGWLDWGLTLL